MKKLLALLLSLVMILSLAACSSGAEEAVAEEPAQTEASGEEAAEPAAEPAAEGKTYKVAMICDSSISDGGWGMSCYNAMVDAAAKYGWTTEVSDMIAQSAYYETIVTYCDLGYDLIYAPGNQYTDAVLQAAEEYPEVAFALLNGGTGTPEQAVNGNVTSLLPDAQQVGWIAGPPWASTTAILKRPPMWASRPARRFPPWISYTPATSPPPIRASSSPRP